MLNAILAEWKYLHLLSLLGKYLRADIGKAFKVIVQNLQDDGKHPFGG